MIENNESRLTQRCQSLLSLFLDDIPTGEHSAVTSLIQCLEAEVKYRDQNWAKAHIERIRKVLATGE